MPALSTDKCGSVSFLVSTGGSDKPGFGTDTRIISDVAFVTKVVETCGAGYEDGTKRRETSAPCVCGKVTPIQQVETRFVVLIAQFRLETRHNFRSLCRAFVCD